MNELRWILLVAGLLLLGGLYLWGIDLILNGIMAWVYGTFGVA